MIRVIDFSPFFSLFLSFSLLSLLKLSSCTDDGVNYLQLACMASHPEV